MKLGYLVDEMGGMTPSKERLDFWDGDVPWVSPKDMKAELICDSIDHISRAAVTETRLRLVPAGSVLIVVRGMILAHTVPVAVTGAPVTINQDMKALIPRQAVSGRFLRYCLQAHQDGLLMLVEEAGHGTRCLRTDLWRKLELTVPGFHAQKAIADFLDRKTAAIDALIEKKQKLLNLLAEKRAALINQAVTKGLNPNVPMKDSGFELLGTVPADWEVVPVRRVLDHIEQGWSPSCDSRLADEDEWGVSKVGCVNGGVFRSSEHKALPSDLEPVPQLEIRDGDLLMSRANTTDLVGSTAVANQPRRKLLLCDKLFRIHLTDRCDALFFSLAMSSGPLRRQIEAASSGASGSMQNIGQDRVRSLIMPVPTLREQRRIVDEVSKAISHARAVEATIRSQIARLQEYRQALITAAVTGQLDVREEAA